jgi:hypothetical protein
MATSALAAKVGRFTTWDGPPFQTAVSFGLLTATSFAARHGFSRSLANLDNPGWR